MSTTKPFAISKRMVWEAYKAVKANRGAPGADGQSLEKFEGNLSNNLYRLWNRLASGAYHPSARPAGTASQARWWRALSGHSNCE